MSLPLFQSNTRTNGVASTKPPVAPSLIRQAPPDELRRLTVDGVFGGSYERPEAEVLEVRTSTSRPDHGFIKCRTTTLNQNGEPVQVLVMNLLVQARPK